MAVYKKNFLKTVVVRLDFDEIQLAQLQSFSKSSLGDFPIVETKEVQEALFEFNKESKQFQQSQKKKIFWQFFNNEKTKSVKIDNNFISIEYNSYKDSKSLLEDIKNVFDFFIKSFQIKTIKRIGLRYINEFDFLKDKDLINEWKSYINPQLVSNLDFLVKNKIKTSRVLNQIIARGEDSNITINYGIANQDYPNEVVKKNLTLDFDCVSKFPLDANNLDITEVIKQYNKHIEILFELSITDNLRSILGKK